MTDAKDESCVDGSSLLFDVWPTDCKFVVDVGCGAGSRAQSYRKLNAGCIYVGIDIDGALADAARPFCTSVIVGDIETISAESFQSLEGADCWVFGDVLEHLRDPWALLRRIRAVIPAHGCLVASIPNAQHWSIQALLNVGEFDYEESGLLDRTHLRWFTLTTIQRMFEKAGFKIFRDQTPLSSLDMPEQVGEAIRAMAAAVGCNPDKAIQEALPIQYVIRATPV